MLTLALAVGARRAPRVTAERAASMDDARRAERIGEALRGSRTRLADLQTGSERTLWALTRLDERVHATTELLERDRLQLADQHAQLLAARNAVNRLRWMLRSLIRINSFRRTFIG